MTYYGPYTITTSDGSSNPQWLFLGDGTTGAGGSGGFPNFDVDWDGNFTIEWYFSFNSLSGYSGLMGVGFPWFNAFPTSVEVFDGAGATHTIATTYTDNTWQHIAIRCRTLWLNGGSVDPTENSGLSGYRTFDIFINGALASSTNINGAAPGDPTLPPNANGNQPIANLKRFGVGMGYKADGTQRHNGGASMSQFRVWTYARNDADIATWYNVSFTDLTDAWVAPSAIVGTGTIAGFPVAVYGFAEDCPTPGGGTRIGSTKNVVTSGFGIQPSSYLLYNDPQSPGGGTTNQPVEFCPGGFSNGPILTVYTAPLGPIGPIIIDESLRTTDSPAINLTFPLEDDLGPTDTGDEEDTDADRVLSVLIPLVAQDWTTLIGYDWEDLELVPWDSVPIEERLPMTDSWFEFESRSFVEEDLGMADSFQIFQDYTWYDTVVEEVTVPITQYDTVDVHIGQFDFQPVVDYTSPSNPFVPTIILDGTYLVQNVDTDPGNTLGTDGRIINIKNGGFISGINVCDMISFSLNLTYNGGSWTIITTSQHANLGDIIYLFGLRSAVTKYGYGVSSQYGKYTILGGEFQALKAGAPVQLAARASFTIANLFPSNNLYLPKPASFSTAAAVCEVLAGIIGISLNWMVPDFPVTDLTQEAGNTIGGAIAAIAAKIGAVVLWNGDQKISIVYPDQSFGNWTVPDCKLLLPSGIQQVFYRNLRPYEATTFPSPLQQQGSVTEFWTNPLFYPVPSKVEPLQTITKLLTSSDPPRAIQLKPDYGQVKIKIVTKTDTSGGYVTTDPVDTWFNWAGTVKKAQDGTSYILISSADFPTTNTDINNGDFEMVVGYTRNLNPLLDQYKQAVGSYFATDKSVQLMNMFRLKFVQESTGNINSLFFGSIPLPGMHVSATLDGVTVSGIAQSVSVSMPGIITVDFATFKRFNFYQFTSGVNLGNVASGL